MYINPLRLRVLDRVFTRETLAEREWTFRCVNQSEVNTNLILYKVKAWPKMHDNYAKIKSNLNSGWHAIFNELVVGIVILAVYVVQFLQCIAIVIHLAETPSFA